MLQLPAPLQVNPPEQPASGSVFAGRLVQTPGEMLQDWHTPPHETLQQRPSKPFPRFAA